jgi:hypothetical protein
LPRTRSRRAPRSRSPCSSPTSSESRRPEEYVISSSARSRAAAGSGSAASRSSAAFRSSRGSVRGSPPRQPGERQPARRIGGEHATTHAEAPETAPCGERTRGARRRVAGAEQVAHGALEQRLIPRRRRHGPPLAHGQIHDADEVTPIRGERVRRDASRRLQFGEERLERLTHSAARPRPSCGTSGSSGTCPTW